MTIISEPPPEFVTEVYISMELLECQEDSIRIFALDSQTIGLSNSPPKLWLDHCLWESKALLVKDDVELTVLLPPEIVRFYQPKKIELAGSIEKDNLLLVISH